MHSQLWLQALSGIEPGVVILDDFRITSGIKSTTLANGVLREIISNGVGCELREGGRSVFRFSKSDRLSAAMLAIQSGCDIELVSAILNWRDFEGLASRALQSAGYTTVSNIRFKNPRMEIDVVGSLNGTAIAVDCKHWRRRNLSSIRNYCEKQLRRCSRLIGDSAMADKRKHIRISRALPVLLTLHHESRKLVDGIPVVPISEFQSFILELPTISEDLRFVC